MGFENKTMVLEIYIFLDKIVFHDTLNSFWNMIYMTRLILFVCLKNNVSWDNELIFSSVRQSVSPSVRQSVSPSVRQSVSPSVRLSASPSGLELQQQYTLSENKM